MDAQAGEGRPREGFLDAVCEGVSGAVCEGISDAVCEGISDADRRCGGRRDG
jgi:hypothetical protein